MRQSVLHFTMSNVISKTQDEALQIVEQILPTFTPEYTVAIEDMYFPGKSNDVPIVLNSVSMPTEYEGDFESRRIIVYTLTFTMKIRFYGTKEPKPIIRSVTADIYTSNVDDSPSDPVDRVQVDLGSETDTPADFTTVTTFGFADDDSPMLDSPQ